MPDDKLKVPDAAIEIVRDVAKRYVGGQQAALNAGNYSKWVNDFNDERARTALLGHWDDPDLVTKDKVAVYRDVLQGALDETAQPRDVVKPTQFFVAGPSGAGKTTFVNDFLDARIEQEMAGVNAGTFPDEVLEAGYQVYKQTKGHRLEADFGVYRAALLADFETRHPKIIAEFRDVVDDFFPFIRPEAAGLANAVKGMSTDLGFDLHEQQTGRGFSDEWIAVNTDAYELVVIGVTRDPVQNAIGLAQRNANQGAKISMDALAGDISGFSSPEGFMKVAQHAKVAVLLSADGADYRPILTMRNGVEVGCDRDAVQRFESYADIGQAELASHLESVVARDGAGFDHDVAALLRDFS